MLPSAKAAGRIVSGAPIRVLVAEDEEPVRAAICDLISGEDGLELAAAASNADDAIEFARAFKPDIALLDVRIPGGGGPHAAREIRTASPDTRSIALSAFDDRTNVLEMLRSGAVGYLVKGNSADEIVDAIRRVASGQSCLSVAILAELVGDLSHDLAERSEADELVRRREPRFHTLFESVPDGVVLVDANGRIVLVNGQTETLFGYHGAELTGEPLELVLPVGDLTDSETRPMGSGLELAGRRKDGSEFSADVSLSRVETEEGRLVAVFIRDVTRQRRRMDLERTISERRVVLGHLVAAAEEERRRIAGDIHDDSIQVMTAAGMRLQILRRSMDDPEQLGRLDELEQTIKFAIRRLRHLIFELRPPALDNEGLSAALRAYLDEAEQTTTAYRLEDLLISEPSEATRVILYRIAQEVLTNIRKHAGAKNAVVTLEARDGGYYVRIRDDGVGFTPESPAARGVHLGLAAIRERAELAGGWLRIESALNGGTTVEFWVAPDTGPIREPLPTR